MSLLLMARGRGGRVEGGGPPPESGDPFFTETFVGGVRNNTNDFIWNPSPGQDAPNAVSVSDDRAFTGTHSLKFNFARTSAGNCEQRFDIGRYTRTLYIDYQLWIPLDFFQRTPNQQKIFMMWRDQYSDAAGGTQQMGLESWSKGTGNTRLRVMDRRVDQNAITDVDPVFQENSSLWPDFIGDSGACIRGQWNRIRLGMELSTAFGVSDGRFKVIVNDTVVADWQNQPQHNVTASPADASFRNGYFMGYSNAGYDPPHAFYIDDIKMYLTAPAWMSL